MKLREIMTSDVTFVSPEVMIREVAKLMEQNDIGAVPVCENNRIVGIITDRDICLRIVANGVNPAECTARDIMTEPIVWCYDDCEIDEAARLMETRQVRRLVVVDREKRLCGIVALGDVATRANERLAGEALEKISEPSHPIH